jgi:hypothetical protein
VLVVVGGIRPAGRRRSGGRGGFLDRGAGPIRGGAQDPLALAAILSVPPGEAAQTLDLAALSWPQALALHGRPVHVRFVVDSLPEAQGGAVLVEAEGPEHESRTVRLPGADLLAFRPGDRLEAEGFLAVAWHRGSGEFPGFVEVRVTTSGGIMVNQLASPATPQAVFVAHESHPASGT